MEAGCTQSAQWPVLGSPAGCGALGAEVHRSCRPGLPARGAGAANGETACSAMASRAAQAAMRERVRLITPPYTTRQFPAT